jgi:hypothetical protein
MNRLLTGDPLKDFPDAVPITEQLRLLPPPFTLIQLNDG